ncbi:MAG: cofactor-independent phosphoglycerate mutase [Planctomycetales bacterium]|nr:cofactor-independent phosphoglycerate mutase [Planctomycetales bacterium]
MKYVIIIPDGAADEPQDSLGGLSPLAAANIPAMDRLAASGVVGRACHTPTCLPAGSEVGNMSLLGYDPLEFFTGRAPIEAAAQGIELGPEDWAVRCNLVTLADQVMRDFTADHIGTDEATQLLVAMQTQVAAQPRWNGTLEFVPGVSYRNLLLWRGDEKPAPFSTDTRATPPHDLTDKTVVHSAPAGPGSDVLVELMDASQAVFAAHPVNATRQAAGHLPATHVWLWGLGRAPQLPTFAERFGVRGAMITAVDLLRGLGALIGWDRIEAPGATGYTDTDYASKGRTAIEALNTYDVVCVHVEAPDEASHEGDAQGKVRALEAIDELIVAPLVAALAEHGPWRMMISPDHPTFLRTKTHTHGDVPVLFAGDGFAADKAEYYNDAEAAQSDLAFNEGWRAMAHLMGT